MLIEQAKGIIMVLIGDLGFSAFWIATSIVLYVALAAFAGVAFTPALRCQLQLAQAGGRDSSDYAAAAKRTTTTGVGTILLIAAIVFLMVMNPGWVRT